MSADHWTRSVRPTTRSDADDQHAAGIVALLSGRPLADIAAYCTLVLEQHAGSAEIIDITTARDDHPQRVPQGRRVA